MGPVLPPYEWVFSQQRLADFENKWNGVLAILIRIHIQLQLNSTRSQWIFCRIIKIDTPVMQINTFSYGIVGLLFIEPMSPFVRWDFVVTPQKYYKHIHSHRTVCDMKIGTTPLNPLPLPQSMRTKLFANKAHAVFPVTVCIIIFQEGV